MKVVFTKSETIAGKLIRAYTKGEVNHCYLVYNNRNYEVFASLKGFLGLEKDGVVIAEKPIGEVVETFDIKVKYPRKLQEFLDAQIGKEYDYLALISIAFHGQYPVEVPRYGYWYCSEHCDVAVKKALGLPDEAVMHTPQSLLEMFRKHYD